MEISNICKKCYLKFLSIKNENEMITLQSQKHKLLIWKNEVICSYTIQYMFTCNICFTKDSLWHLHVWTFADIQVYN